MAGQNHLEVNSSACQVWQSTIVGLEALMMVRSAISCFVKPELCSHHPDAHPLSWELSLVLRETLSIILPAALSLTTNLLSCKTHWALERRGEKRTCYRCSAHPLLIWCIHTQTHSDSCTLELAQTVSMHLSHWHTFWDCTLYS